MLSLDRVFVTVGTTQFKDLIDVIQSDEILTLLQNYRCRNLIIQYGASAEIATSTKENILQKYSINIDCYDYKPSISSDIASSDLVISHAGAGSCIEVLKAKKPLIVVVNSKLMHNHQTELAHQLSIDGHLLYCFTDTLAETLNTLNQKISTLKPYEPGNNNMKKFVKHLNGLMGFE